MFISITGKMGSGKSTICDILHDEYEYEIYSTGKIHRDVAKEMGVDTLELNKLLRNDPKLDHVIDDQVVKISHERDGDKIIFDSRLAWHFVPKSFKIYTIVDPYIAAQRVIDKPRDTENPYENLEDAKNKLLERAEIENIRFHEIYNINNFDYQNYNLILDTSYLSPQELTNIVVSQTKEYNDDYHSPKVIISPKSLYPTQSIRNITNSELEEVRKDDALKNRFKQNPVKILSVKNYHFLIDGHHRWLSALIDKCPYIQAELIEFNDHPELGSQDDFLSGLQELGRKTIYDFEDAGSFRYSSYPEFY